MGRPWKPSIADRLEDVAASLLDVSYAVAAIAEQLRENSTKGRKHGSAFSKERQEARGGRLNLAKTPHLGGFSSTRASAPDARKPGPSSRASFFSQQSASASRHAEAPHEPDANAIRYASANKAHAGLLR
jgi:hypothetical protein